ncbi:MAG: polysaccharide deacetylase family protein [Myxococcales bacterium]|nr:polysaccharide deacetylase family protein [Myxococcales bacterium]
MSRLPTKRLRLSAHLIGLCILLLGGTTHAEGEAASPVEPAEETISPWSNAKIVGGKEAPGYVTFTFDDGPDLKSTPEILSVLERFEVPATFFVVGRHFAKPNDTAKAGAELLRDMERRGFVIGNHTSNHQHLPSLSTKAARAAIDGNAADLAKVLGHPVHLFRPPFGATSGPIRRMLRKGGKTTVRWNIDSQDFVRAQRKGIAERVLREILSKGGGVVLLHDTKSWTARMLPGLFEDLEKANCERLENGQGPILPVSLHYFLRDRNGTPRRIPSEVLKVTQKSYDRLTDQCTKDI